MNERPPAKGFAPDQAKVDGKGSAAGKIGVLLVNLGTPDGTDYWSVRRYLKEFLSDRRVIETNRALWWVILNFVVLTIRPSRSGAKYRSVWNEELDEVSLAHHHPRARREGRGGARRAPRSRGRLGDALRQSEHRLAHRGACGARLRSAARLPALSAIFRLDHGERERQGLRCAEVDALSTRGPHRAGLSGRPRLHRRARATRSGRILPGSIGSRRRSSPPITGCPRAMSTRAIPTWRNAR